MTLAISKDAVLTQQCLLVAGGGEFQSGGTEFGQVGVDFALALEPGQYALGVDLGAQWLTGQVRDKGFEVGYIQLDLGRPGGLWVERLD